MLLAESHLIGGLTGLGLSVSDTHSVVQIPVHSQVQSFAVDMRGPSVVVSGTILPCILLSRTVLLTLMLMVCFLQFINDLESDRQYAGWPKSLRQVSIT